MSRQFVQNNYNVGDVVCAKADPQQKLVIRRYVDHVYYCKVQEDPDAKDLVYFEREIMEDKFLLAQNKKLLASKQEEAGTKNVFANTNG